MLLVLKNLLFTLIVPGTVAVYVPLFLISHDTPEFTLFTVVSVALLGIGGSIYLWCLWDFASFGRGTPAPLDPPRNLVVRGLYRYTRNPMYVGVLTVIFGWAMFFGALPIAGYGLAVAGCFHLVVVLYEEPYLSEAFGSSYDEYCQNVSRWLPFTLH